MEFFNIYFNELKSELKNNHCRSKLVHIDYSLSILQRILPVKRSNLDKLNEISEMRKDIKTLLEIEIEFNT